MRKLIVVSIAAVLSTSSVHAQSCLGLPSFSSGSIHFNGAGEFPDSATAWAVGIGAGRPQSLFGNLGGGQVSYEGIDEKSTFGFLEFGYQLPLGPAQLCPVAGGSFAVGPDDEAAGIKLTSRAASAGVALGLPIGGVGFKLIPNAALKFEYLSLKVEDEVDGSSNETSNSGVLDLGLALVFFDRFSIQPLYHIPFGGDDVEEANFGVFAAVSFGRF